MDPDRPLDPTNPITAERVGPGKLGPVYIAVALLLGLGAATAGLLLRTQANTVPGDPEGVVRFLAPDALAALSALGVGVAATCIALAGRRMWHSPAVGVLASLLFVLDPWTLAINHVASERGLVFGFVAAGFLAFLSLRPGVHWVGGILLAVAALLDPPSWTLAIPLALMGLLRGHVYAAPRHMGLAALQGFVLPGLAAIIGMSLGAPSSCMTWGNQAILRDAGTLDDLLLLPNPVTWFGGVAALLFLAGAALLVVARQARIARLPGRTQIRLFDALDVQHGRALWLAFVVVIAPPHLWILLLPLALAAGVATLGQDAPGFGAAVALVLLAFAILVVVRGWSAIHGDGADNLLDLVPWARTLACSS